MFLISLGKRGSFFKPLFFEFSNDEESYKYTNHSLMVGRALYHIPCLSEEDKMTGYFPNTDWMDLQTRKIYKTYNKEKTNGTTEEFLYDYKSVQLYMRGGFIIPHQDLSHTAVYNTYWLHKLPTDLIIQPDSISHIAIGDIVFDKDEVDTITNKKYNFISMKFEDNTLSFIKENISPYNDKDILIGKLKFCRMSYLINGNSFYVSIKVRDGEIYNLSPIMIDGENFDVDLSEIKLTYSIIDSVSLLEFN